MRREVVKSVELSLLPLTRAKQGELSSLFSEYIGAANEILHTLNSERPNSETRLHHLTYARIRKRSRLPAQLVCAARLDAWAKRRHKVSRFKHLPVSCNVPGHGPALSRFPRVGLQSTSPPRAMTIGRLRLVAMPAIKSTSHLFQ